VLHPRSGSTFVERLFSELIMASAEVDSDLVIRGGIDAGGSRS
jgi:hypothetical protein